MDGTCHSHSPSPWSRHRVPLTCEQLGSFLPLRPLGWTKVVWGSPWQKEKKSYMDHKWSLRVEWCIIHTNLLPKEATLWKQNCSPSFRLSPSNMKDSPKFNWHERQEWTPTSVSSLHWEVHGLQHSPRTWDKSQCQDSQKNKLRDTH